MKIYRKSELTSKGSTAKKSDSISDSERGNMYILMDARRCWDSLYKSRIERRRCRMYTYGNQWGDVIYDPDSKRYITEENHIKSQGKVPLKNNLIRQLVKSVLGQFRSNQTEPVCVARDRDEQKAGEMMSVAIQYVYQLNRLSEVDARMLEEFLISGVSICKSYYNWKSGKDKQDVWVDMVNMNRVFFDNSMEDVRHWDCSIIGEIHDVSLADVVSAFSTNEKTAERIRAIYKSCNDQSVSSMIENLSSERLDNLDFFTSGDPSLCRVIEVWKKESKPRYKCHDVLKGEYYKIDINELDGIKLENQKRTEECLANGVPEDDAPTIEYEWFMDRFWYFRFLSPYGNVLSEGESPYYHKEHPYSFKLYPFIDGEVHSFVSDIIDQQRYINRLITMIDFIMGASAKGVLMFPEEAIPDGMTKEEIADEWVRYNGVIYCKTKQGQRLPEQISTNSTNIGAFELLNIQLKLLDDISGIHGAMQGKETGSNTAASLYAQQAQNSSVNLIDIFESFKTFREDRDAKVMKLIQQYYQDTRYMNIAGKQYSDSAKIYHPEKVRNAEFDISISESASSPAYRMISNDFLMNLFDKGSISVEQLLENGNFPFSDRLLQSIQSDKERMMQGQGAAGVPQELAGQISSGADPRAMEMIRGGA